MTVTGRIISPWLADTRPLAAEACLLELSTAVTVLLKIWLRRGQRTPCRPVRMARAGAPNEFGRRRTNEAPPNYA